MECNQSMEPEEKIELTEDEHFLTNQINKINQTKPPKQNNKAKLSRSRPGKEENLEGCFKKGKEQGVFGRRQMSVDLSGKDLAARF